MFPRKWKKETMPKIDEVPRGKRKLFPESTLDAKKVKVQFGLNSCFKYESLSTLTFYLIKFLICLLFSFSIRFLNQKYQYLR